MGQSVEKRPSPGPLGLRKETQKWFATHTIQDVREIATDLENAGEDVTDLLDALTELERFVTENRSAQGARRKA